MQNKVYFNDCHENPKNIADWKEFISKYFEYKQYTHHWIQIPVTEAKQFEEATDNKGNKLMVGSFALEWEDLNGTLMQEYHVDCHPGFVTKYVSSNINKKFGGNLSICKPVDCHPKLIIGQDECIIKENLFPPNTPQGDHE